MLIHRIPSLPTWTSSFRDLDDMRREMERLFDTLNESSGFRTAGVFPPINVTETPEALTVRAELPGVRPKDLEITVESNTLTISGAREPEEDPNVSYHRREREWGTFRRSFTMPLRVDGEKVRARYNNGILIVEMPKAAEVRPRQIAVQAGN
jgi:HSP20 family protein